MMFKRECFWRVNLEGGDFVDLGLPRRIGGFREEISSLLIETLYTMHIDMNQEKMYRDSYKFSSKMEKDFSGA